MTDALLTTPNTDDTAINDMLAKLDANDHSTRALLREINFCNLVAHLKAAGVSSVACDFYGSGDSGDIEDAATHDAQGQPVDLDATNQTIEYLGTTREFDTENKEWRFEVVRTEKPLQNALDDFIETEINATSVNWYDNEGGSGHWNLNVDTNELDFEINVNIVESHCEHSESEAPEFDVVADDAKSRGLEQLLTPALTLDEARRRAADEAKAAAQAQSTENATIR